MKAIYKFLSLLAVVSLAAVACNNKEETYVPGAEEDADCYGVFFPEQSIPTELDPAAALELLINVSRTNASDEITVPLVIKQDSDVFEFSNLVFKNGQSDTTLLVKFPKMTELNTEYTCSVSIEDPKYAKLYGAVVTDLSLNISRVKWNDLTYTDPETGEVIDYAIYGEDMITGIFSASPVDYQVKVQEHSQIPGYYRLIYPYDGKYPYNDKGDWDESKSYDIYIHAEDPDFVWFEEQQIGVDWGYGMMSIASNGGVRIADGTSIADAKAYGDGGTLLKGVIKFPQKALRIYMRDYSATGYWWGNSNNRFKIVLPGGVEVDYSYSVAQAGPAEEGVIPVDFTLGDDIEYIKYNTYAGVVEGEDLDSALAETIADDSLPKVTESSTVGLTFDETGVYTLLYVVQGNDGERKGSDTIVLYYLADGDERDVNVEAYLQNVSFEDVIDGVSAETNLSFLVKGEELTDVKLGAYKYVDIVSDQDAVIEDVQKQASLDSKAIASVNGNGYTGLVSGLVPGTDYVLVVWASNGYTDTVVASDVVTTAGDPLPIYQSYDSSSYYPAGALSSRDDFIGTWNYYAIDVYGSLGMREYVGKVKVTASETETEGPDDSGNYDEYVYLDGLFGSGPADAASYGYDAGDGVYEMDVYNGVVYYFTNTSVDGKAAIHFHSGSLDGWYTGAAYHGAFIPVAEGYYAFVDVAGRYAVDGLRLVQQYVWSAYTDLLLVDPAKDDNGVAPAAVQQKIAKAHELAKEVNYVETERGRMQSLNEKLAAWNPVSSKGSIHADATVRFGLRKANVSAKTIQPATTRSNFDKNTVKVPASID